MPPPEWSALQMAGPGFLTSSVPCPLRALALLPPQMSREAPPPRLGCGCAASWAWGAAILDLYQEGGRFGFAHRGRHCWELLNWPPHQSCIRKKFPAPLLMLLALSPLGLLWFPCPAGRTLAGPAQEGNSSSHLQTQPLLCLLFIPLFQPHPAATWEAHYQPGARCQ